MKGNAILPWARVTVMFQSAPQRHTRTCRDQIPAMKEEKDEDTSYLIYILLIAMIIIGISVIVIYLIKKGGSPDGDLSEE